MLRNSFKFGFELEAFAPMGSFYDEGYENESYMKKENRRKQKELENQEDRERLIDVGALERAEKEKEREKKRKLYNVQMDDLDNFNRRKEANNLRKKEELCKNA